MTGTACAASFCVTTTPKRDAICAMNRTRTGAPSASAPGSAMKRADSATALRAARGQRNTPLLRVRLVIASPQGEHLQAGEGAPRVGEILPLAARDVSNRPQHDDRRDREFYRQRGETVAGN